MGFGFLKKKNNEVFLALDLGTEAVKSLICQRKNQKTFILGASTEYFERYGVFNGRDFGTDLVRKAISEAIEESYQNFTIFLGQKINNFPVFLTLPPNIFKARIVCQSFCREKPEKKISQDEKEVICQQILKEAKQEISQEIAENSGILPSELYWVNLKILGFKIDGYQVLKLEGYEGKNLEIKILAAFLPKYYLENIKKVFGDLGLNISKIVHLAENLSAILKDIKGDVALLDVGGQTTQVFLVRRGELSEIFDFEIAGKTFSQCLVEKLGISENSARALKEEYSRRHLSPEVEERIREIFLPEKINWYQNLKVRQPPVIFELFGGGSLIPEIRQVLKENGKEVRFIFPKDFKNIKDRTKKIKSPQYIPALLII